MSDINIGVKKSGADKYAVSAIISKGGKVLLLMRHGNDQFPNLYEFPGGGVEETETLEDALVREVYEESGLKVKSILRYVGSLKGEIHGTMLKRYTFLVSVEDSDDVKLSHEHEKYVWAGKKDLSNIELTSWTEQTLRQFWE